jgi:CubicO group peptidase (beta-lactamase class C family)
MSTTPASASASASASLAETLDGLLKPWNRSDAPGLVIGVARDGASIYRRGFGLASVEHGTANTPKTRMRIGSTSKHFAALAALLLTEEGRLDIDVPVRHYLPELVGVSGAPSLRQMMQHTSGLRDPYDLAEFLVYGNWSTIVCAGAGLEIAQRFTSLNFRSGERMIYCNQGYHLLSLVIERVSGISFESFLQQRLLAPLGMTDTALLPSDMSMMPRLASLHIPQSDGSYRRGIYPNEELLGSGGMVSTIDDMLVWLAHLRSEQKRVGAAQSWQQMLQRPHYSSGALGDYCLGLTRETYRGVELIHHAGAVAGGTCQMLTVPAHALDIILMFNRMDGPASAVALKVIDAVLDNKLAPAIAPLPIEGREGLIGRWYAADSHRIFGVVAQPQKDQAPALALSINDAVLGLLREENGGLIATSPAHGAVQLRLPAVGEQGSEVIEFIDSGHSELCVRLPDAGASSAALAPELLGRYRYADMNLMLSVVLEADVLYLDLHPSCGSTRYRLTPYSPDVCGCTLESSWPQWLPAQHLGATLAIERRGGAVAGLWLSNSRTRDLWLERA